MTRLPNSRRCLNRPIARTERRVAGKRPRRRSCRAKEVTRTTEARVVHTEVPLRLDLTAVTALEGAVGGKLSTEWPQARLVRRPEALLPPIP